MSPALGYLQDLKYVPGTECFLRIGSNNDIREFVSIHRSSHPDAQVSPFPIYFVSYCQMTGMTELVLGDVAPDCATL